MFVSYSPNQCVLDFECVPCDFETSVRLLEHLKEPPIVCPGCDKALKPCSIAIEVPD